MTLFQKYGYTTHLTEADVLNQNGPIEQGDLTVANAI